MKYGMKHGMPSSPELPALAVGQQARLSHPQHEHSPLLRFGAYKHLFASVQVDSQLGL